MNRRNLSVLLVEPGAAAALKPTLDAWVLDDPGFDWTLWVSDLAHAVLQHGPAKSKLTQVCFKLNEVPPGLSLSVGSSQALLASCANRPAERAAVAEMRQKAGAALQYIDNWYGYAARLAASSQAEWPDQILVIDDRAFHEAKQEGFPEEMIQTVGHPGWENTQEIASTSSRAVVFLGSPIRRDYGRRLGYDETDAFRLLLETVTASPSSIERLIYAPHPQQDDVEACGADVKKFSPDVMRECGTTIGTFSAPMVDAFLSGRRVISLQPNVVGADMCALSRHGRIPRCSSIEQLVCALSRPPQSASTLRDLLAGSGERMGQCVRKALSI